MRKLLLLPAGLLSVFCALFYAPSMAQVPPILLEACNAMEPAHKRLECLRAANDLSVPRQPQAVAPRRHVPRQNPPVCYVEPGGGSYTLTESGRKDYSGC